jgi:hypothetical protein
MTTKAAAAVFSQAVVEVQTYPTIGCAIQGWSGLNGEHPLPTAVPCVYAITVVVYWALCTVPYMCLVSGWNSIRCH